MGIQTTWMAAAILFGTLAWGGSASGGEITVCLQTGSDMTLASRAKATAARILGTVDIQVRWRGFRNCPEDQESTTGTAAISVSLSVRTPADRLPGALAYALPYEGTHIVVFLDRVRAIVPAERVAGVMGHVLAHEIAHILQGSSRHSEAGVMKAHWDSRDYADMAYRPLTFTDWDARLIRHGLEARR